MNLKFPSNTHNFVFIGESGSGKTELSANLALSLAKTQDKQVYFIDMDQTKMLFRARDFSNILKQGNVNLPNMPELMDSPLVPDGVTNLLQDDNIICVMDVGGNALGASMIGQYATIFATKNTKFYYVINPCRSFSSNINDIEESFKTIIHVARIPEEKVEFISNPYLGTYTTPELILDYHKGLEENLAKRNWHVSYLSTAPQYAEKIQKVVHCPVLCIDLYVQQLYTCSREFYS